jgi:hypothetical protein
MTAPDRFDKCDECGHYRSEHTPPEMTCAYDVLAFGEWHVCPCSGSPLAQIEGIAAGHAPLCPVIDGGRTCTCGPENVDQEADRG